MPEFSFVHAADLHLDSPLRGITREMQRHPALARAVAEATFAAYRNLVELCLRERVDFLLLAGDLYDVEEQSLRAMLVFRDGLARLAEAGIAVYLVHGNHDPYGSRSEAVALPPNTQVFAPGKPQTQVFTRGGEALAAISGVSHKANREPANLARRFPERPAGLFHIGLLHANVGATGHENYAPCELADLTGAQVDYWALGHVHQGRILSQTPWVVYPGNTQGRSIVEAGPRQAAWVRVGGPAEVHLELLPVDAVRWEVLTCDIAAYASLDALETGLAEALLTAGAAAGERPLLARVRLGGRGPLFAELQRDERLLTLRERLREALAGAGTPVWVEDLRRECRPELDLAQHRGSATLIGEVLRAADELRAGATPETWQKLVEPLYGYPRAGRVLTPLTAAELAQLLAEAEFQTAALLEEGGP